ncbi:MAG: aldehyde dehydrogenase (NADP(+)) [Microbacteriaceae bacterium]|nr:aldehyde dehydrogenase (NADP(+)) [Microbacteriaceae bacterium]
MTTTAGLIADGVLIDGEAAIATTVDPSTGATVGAFRGATRSQLDRIAGLAADAEDRFRHTGAAVRAALLEDIALRMEDAGDEIVDLAVAESGLSRARMVSELGRTTGQLRMFAAALEEGGIGHRRADSTGGPTPVPLLLRTLAVGPVAVFAASNFPLAFSTAGGDVASALAAGCPVIVKAHSAHVATSVRVARAIADAVRASGLPGGVFGHLIGDREIGTGLVAHPAIRAVGFTGSRGGGQALARVAAERPHPIPVFAEMSSVNPVFVLPGSATEAVADGFVASLTLGGGQFCTNPGLVFVPAGAAGDAFVARSARLVEDAAAQTMLTGAIARAYSSSVEDACRRGAQLVASGIAAEPRNAPAAHLLEIDLAAFQEDARWMDEMFGAAGLVVRYPGAAQLVAAAEALDGQLTATIWHEGADDEATLRALLPVLERKAGRLISNGWPTGVAVSPAMVHGGPSPATTDARFTAVGTLAADRFLRPVAYQGFPESLLEGVLGADTNS